METALIAAGKGMTRRGSKWVLAALAVVSALALSGYAEASVCSDLSAQLRAVDGGGQNSSAARRAAAQVAQQQAQLSQAVGAARQAGCMGLGLFRARSPYCPSMMARVNQLQASLNAAEARLRQTGGGGFAGAGARSRILAAMAQNGCNGGGGDSGGERVASSGGGSRGAVCVRTCDGYAFPLGGQVSRNELDEAQASCEARCPGAEVQLFTPRGSSQAEMVSPDGQRYGDLANAFAYQRQFVPNCGCTPPGGWPVVAAVTPETGEPVVPVPLPSPAASEDPETIADRSGDLVPKPVAGPQDGQEVAAASADARVVRLVGPSYYYAGAATMVLGRQPAGSSAAIEPDAKDDGVASIGEPSPETTGSTEAESGSQF
jgi:hypothetical protein